LDSDSSTAGVRGAGGVKTGNRSTVWRAGSTAFLEESLDLIFLLLEELRKKPLATALITSSKVFPVDGNKAVRNKTRVNKL